MRILAPRVQFLGHVICEYGVQVDPAKIEAVIKWDPPKNPLKNQQFSWIDGLLSTVRIWFFSIAVPLTKLIRKNEKFIWTDVQQLAFQ